MDPVKYVNSVSQSVKNYTKATHGFLIENS